MNYNISDFSRLAFSHAYRHLPGFREIDFQFADFMVRLSTSGTTFPESEESSKKRPLICLFQSALLLSYMTGRQNSALDLKKIAGRPIEAFLEVEEMIEPSGIILPILEILTDMLKRNGTVVAPPPWKTPVKNVAESEHGGSRFSEKRVFPMILDEDALLYLNRYWHYERGVADAIKMRAAVECPPPGDHGVLHKLFPENGKQSVPKSIPIPGSIPTKNIPPEIAAPENIPGIEWEKINTGAVEQKSSMPDWQKIACLAAFQSNFTVISGGPGTGKTTTVSKLLALLLSESPDLKIHLVAPTGKAADRLVKSIQSTKKYLNIPNELKNKIPDSAQTIHRYLNYLPQTGNFRYNAANRQTSDVLVVDEASMVSLPLFAHLFDALKPSAKIILLGDKDQLSSVENGSVFGDISAELFMNRFSHDFIDKNRPFFPENFKHLLTCQNKDVPKSVPEKAKTDKDKADTLINRVIKLEHSYRFGPDSGIGYLSFLINTISTIKPFREIGEIMAFLRRRQLSASAIRKITLAGQPVPSDRIFTDIVWHDLKTAEQLSSLLQLEAVEKYAAYRDAVSRFQHGRAAPFEVLDAFDRFRVLCAVNCGPYGVKNLNALMETLLFGRKQSLFYSGRPIMVLSNDYTQQLFNGDTGVILTGQDGHTRAFFRGESGEVRTFAPAYLPGHATAFAMTVHKSQGSEFNEVLMIMPGRDNRILTREIVYTGITRARKRIAIAGTEQIFKKAMGRRMERTSGLQKKLEQLIT